MASAESPPNDIKLNHLLGTKSITVMLVGAAGAGKSSLINSLIKLVQQSDVSPHMKLNNYIPTATAELMGGHTMMREPVELTDTLTILDNRGWHDWTHEKARHELIAQIRGETFLEDDVNWESGADDALSFAVSPKVDCISIVINGVGGIEAVEGIRELIETCRQNTGRRPSVVITHMDKVTETQIESMKATLETYAIGRQNIFAVQNVTTSNNNLEAKSTSSLCELFARCNIEGDAGATYTKGKEERNLKKNKTLKELEETKRSNEIHDLKHDVRVTEQSEAKMQLKIKTEIAKQRADVEEEIMVAKKVHDQLKNTMEEKRIQQENKIHTEIYSKYLGDLYKVDKK